MPCKGRSPWAVDEQAHFRLPGSTSQQLWQQMCCWGVEGLRSIRDRHYMQENEGAGGITSGLWPLARQAQRSRLWQSQVQQCNSNDVTGLFKHSPHNSDTTYACVQCAMCAAYLACCCQCLQAPQAWWEAGWCPS